MDDHAGGLVDDDNLFVFVDDVERDVFGREVERRGRCEFYLDAVARADFVRWLGGAAVDERVAVFDEPLDGRAARALDARGEHRVEPRARFLFGDLEGERLDLRFGRGFVAVRVAHASASRRRGDGRLVVLSSVVRASPADD